MSAAAGLADSRAVVGWYGKLAGLGDFAQRRLPPEWVRACDDWVSGAMRGAREQLGARWMDIYLTAPVLRFAWAPGVVDSQWWFGVLMPSCDSVGRYFPLTMAQARAQPPQDRIALDHLERWYEHLARAAVGTLQATSDAVEALEAALQDAPPWPTPGRTAPLQTQPGAGADWVNFGPAEPLSVCVHALAGRELRARLAGSSVWWRLTEGGGGDGMAIVTGLPDGPTFAALLTGAQAG